jgi:glyoxylase-like metal-dependent hydrolase (beta-lactamase superfamily II)
MDGGAMFGVVPKSLWSRYAQPDEQNRIDQASNCLLVDTGRNKVLIDTGYGGKLSDKERHIFAAENGSPLVVSLGQAGVSPDEIDTVILSHLHFDHAGGGTKFGESERLEPTFPNAQYVVQEGEWTLATADLPELEGSYPPQNILPLREADCLRLIDGDVEIVPGIRAIVTGGHTASHQVIVIESGSEAGIYLADLCPTAAHLPIRWGMAYDLDDVLQLRRKKRELLTMIADRGWWAFFDHDPQTTHARLATHEKRDFQIVN